MDANLSNDTKALLRYGVLYRDLNDRQKKAVENWTPTTKQIAKWRAEGLL